MVSWTSLFETATVNSRRMKSLLPRVPGLLLFFSLLSGCATSDVVPLLAADDCGPKPKDAAVLAAAWLNKHYRFTPPNPVQPAELLISEPEKVATVDPMAGRLVGWQVVLGPENKVVSNYSDAKYTRLIINRDRILSVASSNHPFLTVPK
jgi:hypothetical protein